MKRKLIWNKTVRKWQDLVRQIPQVDMHVDVKSVVIIPPDPYTLLGSRGDDAMIRSFLSIAREYRENIKLYVITASDEADKAAREKGLEPVQIWAHSFSPQTILSRLQEISPDALVMLGADVMDGYYNPYLPFHAAMYADLATRIGARSAIMGFSFNRNPFAGLKEIFDLTSPDVTINLRDANSLERFNAFCEHDAELVADIAFLLKPDLESQASLSSKEWVEKTHKEGRRAFIFNIHPMLFKDATQKQIDSLIVNTADALEKVTKERDVNWMFLPHDFRGVVGDNICLTPLAKELEARGLSDRFVHFSEDRAASELKAIASHVDGVITARMHLAISSLGMGVPVATLTYQAKFAGLFKHFDLPDWLRLAPSESTEFRQDFETLMLRFIDESEALGKKVKEELPKVKKRAMKNFEPLFLKSDNGA